jgi:hypothetical protein
MPVVLYIITGIFAIMDVELFKQFKQVVRKCEISNCYFHRNYESGFIQMPAKFNQFSDFSTTTESNNIKADLRMSAEKRKIMKCYVRNSMVKGNYGTFTPDVTFSVASSNPVTVL